LFDSRNLPLQLTIVDFYFDSCHRLHLDLSFFVWLLFTTIVLVLANHVQIWTLCQREVIAFERSIVGGIRVKSYPNRRELSRLAQFNRDGPVRHYVYRGARNIGCILYQQKTPAI
jgi:hypothetical protein